MHELDPQLYADLIGAPFAWGGRGPDEFDCYGLVRELEIRRGAYLPEQRTPGQTHAVPSVVALELLQQRWVSAECVPGVMVLFNMPVVMGGVKRLATTHCGYMVSNFEFVHAWEKTGGVTREAINGWSKRVAGFYRYQGKA